MDLPVWHHLHYAEESSSDDSLDSQQVLSAPPKVKNLDILNYGSDIKRLIEEKEHLESKTSLLSSSEGLHGELHMNEVQVDGDSVWRNMYDDDLHDQSSELASGFEEEEISHAEIVSASAYGRPPSNSNELYSAATLPHEEDGREGLGKYSYFNANTQFAGTVKPWVKSHKCSRCGRQFGRLYNLEKHICIKTALGIPQQPVCNVGYNFSNSGKKNNVSAKKSEQNQESMNRLESMCVEAQKQLQSLKGHYKNEEEYADLSSTAMEVDLSDMQTWNQEGLPGDGTLVSANKISSKGTVTCHRCGRKFRSICNLEFHVCRNEETRMFVSPNLNASQNTIPVPSLVKVEQDSDSHSEHIPSPSEKLKSFCNNSDSMRSLGNSRENIVSSATLPGKTVEIFKCQQCKRVYNKRCSYATHMRWHMKERDFASSVTSTVERAKVTEDQEPGWTALHDAASNPVNSHKSSQTFTCEYCCAVFNKHCSYATHTRWHLKESETVSTVTSPTPKPARGDQESSRLAKQVPSMSVKHLKSSEKNTSTIILFSCQLCGRVFNKSCSFSNHTRWHTKEREFLKSVKAEAQMVLMEGEEYVEVGDITDVEDQQNRPTDRDHDDGITFSDVHDDNSNFQGFSGQVKHLNLGDLHTNGEKPNSSEDSGDNPNSNQVDSNQQRPSTLVPEYIFELVVGTEDVCEVLLAEGRHLIQNVEDLRTTGDDEEITPRPQVGSFITTEPKEPPIYFPLILPYALVARLLKRPKPPRRCRDCGTRFYQAWRLQLHQHKHTNRKTLNKHQCDCGRTPVGSLHFLRHQLEHLSSTAFICAVCGKVLRGYRQLQAHSWLHPLVSQFQCTCGARFTQLPKYLWHSLLNKTKDRKHPTQGKRLVSV
ncbi:zinc finger protein 16-like isoform X2 [Pseudophryne corroboree]